MPGRQHRIGSLGAEQPGSGQTIGRPYIAPSQPLPLHALSLPTWWIHLASVLEWVAAMVAIKTYGLRRLETGWRWLSLAMLPALVSAMAACTWHLYDNSADLQGLVVLQAGLTTLGNGTLAVAAWNLLRQQRAKASQQQP